MSLHTGPTYHSGDVSIGAPDPNVIRGLPKESDVTNSTDWLEQALERDDIYHFCIFWKGMPVGQILLHDMDRRAQESLVGYHLFETRYRGQGIGTTALRLLQQYVIEATDLTRLIIITSRDNLASQRIAQKCGFTYSGGSREDPINDMVFEWHTPVRSLND
jgi:ribosomal-protein-alanine N-acetyltransferase